MKIAFICVNFNNSETTLLYIQSILAIDGDYFRQVIIVDNGSRSDDLSNIEKNTKDIPEVILIKTGRNTGYFPGLNIGIGHARKLDDYDFMVVGNNDITFSDDFLNVLRKIKLRHDELIISPDVLTSSGIHENPHVIQRKTMFIKLLYDIYYFHYYFAFIISKFYSDERKAKSFDPERKHIYMGIGALYLLTSNFFNYFEHLSEEVFLYGEEAVLGNQIASVGCKILYEPSLKCFHNESKTTSKLGFKKRYHIVRNSYKTYRKYL